MATGLSAEALLQLIDRPGCAAQPGTLHLIATPIGNLGDLTLRSARLLADVDLDRAADPVGPAWQADSPVALFNDVFQCGRIVCLSVALGTEGP